MKRSFALLIPSLCFIALTGATAGTQGAQPKFDTDIFHVSAAKFNEVVSTQKGGTNKGGNEFIPKNETLGIRASVGRKEMTPPITNPEAHDDFGHIYQIAEGSGTLVLGGELVNPKHQGTQWSGTAITGGKEYHMSKGDLITVPIGIPHWWKDVPKGGVTYVAFHIFRDRH